MILFTADWHIKLGQKNVPVKWATNRYKMFLEQVKGIEHSTHIVGGDLFDRMPSLAELGIYFDFLSQIDSTTIIYDGNHEATKKNQTFFDLLKGVSHDISSEVEIVTETKEFDNFTILPYADLHKKDSIEKCNKSYPLFTHVRGEIPPHVKPEVNLDRFDDFPIVFAGDLHNHNNSQRNIVYPGSPMTTSFHRTKVDTGYILIDSTDLTKWSWHKFNLPQLIRKTVVDEADMIPTDYDHTIYEIEGDLQKLSTVANSDLLDKKIIKRNSEVSINLVDKTIEEELYTYLEQVLEVKGDALEATMEVFNAYSRTG
jgi:DNA repair exonuclease SbcCD nuclease subunit